LVKISKESLRHKFPFTKFALGIKEIQFSKVSFGVIMQIKDNATPFMIGVHRTKHCTNLAMVVLSKMHLFVLYVKVM